MDGNTRVRELNFIRTGELAWVDRPDPVLVEPTDVLVRPIIASRCDGDSLPIHRPVSRPMQAGLRLGLLDPSIGAIAGEVPFQGPFGIGHEAIAEVTAVGTAVTSLAVGDLVIVPWAISCGQCRECRLGLTAKCSVAVTSSPGGMLAAYGFGPASGPWGGLVADSVRVPYADAMLVRVPDGIDPLRLAAASDNLTDAWRAVVPALRQRPDGTVLVIGGGARSIGLYAAGIAVRSGAATVDYVDDDPERLRIAEELGARVISVPRKRWTSVLDSLPTRYDVAVEASSAEQGLRDALRALRAGGICTGTGYYVGASTKLPVMDMYATSATLNVGVSHIRPALPELLAFVAETGFPAEKVTTLLADWADAPEAYAARTTKVVLHRPRLTASRDA
jgi:threonine dehydrogenase-like Zn-dependent dehydrogenase